MQKLEEEIFNFDPKDIQTRIGSRSAIRIRSSREKETETKPLANLIQSYQNLAESVRGTAKRKKRHTTFSALTREVILKKRTEGTTHEKQKHPSSLKQLMVLN